MPTSRSIASAADRSARRSSSCRASRARLSARRLSTSPDPLPPRTVEAFVDVRVGIGGTPLLFLLPADGRGGGPAACGADVSASAAASMSPQCAEERAYVADQQIGRFHGGEVAAAVELRPAHDVVAALAIAADGDVLGEHSHAGRCGARLLTPGGRMHVLLIRPRR